MIIFPAMDLYEGKVVRLRQGRFDNATVFPVAPAEMGRACALAGAEWIHIIDLEGAKYGVPRNLSAIGIMKKAGLLVQYGGGLRTAEAVQDAFLAGADRVYVGTLMAGDTHAASAIFSAHGQAVIPAVDIREGKVAVKGWIDESEKTRNHVLQSLEDMGFSLFLVTSADRDGTGFGPDMVLYRELAARFPSSSFIAAGGIASLAHLHALKSQGLYGAVLGKALYDGSLSLPEVLREMRPC